MAWRCRPPRSAGASVIVTTLSRNGCGRPHPCIPVDANRTGREAGPAHVVHQYLSASRTARSIGVVAGAALSAGRNTHRHQRGHIQSPGFWPFELLCRATGITVGGAGSIRWIAFLGRACRCHRQLLSSRGNREVVHCRNVFSICPVSAHGNPSRPASSRRPC